MYRNVAIAKLTRWTSLMNSLSDEIAFSHHFPIIFPSFSHHLPISPRFCRMIAFSLILSQSVSSIVLKPLEQLLTQAEHGTYGTVICKESWVNFMVKLVNFQNESLSLMILWFVYAISYISSVILHRFYFVYSDLMCVKKANRFGRWPRPFSSFPANVYITYAHIYIYIYMWKQHSVNGSVNQYHPRIACNMT